MFEVWAPKAKKVELVLGNRTLAMEPAAQGWWTAAAEQPGAETDYAYRLDGGTLLPDPRSPWQPNGVHAASRTVDHAKFPWTDQHFQSRPLASAIIYEMHVGTFTPAGTFRSAIERLPHLVELGVTHVELMPVAEWDGPRGWGYDGVHLYAPHEAYGGPLGLKQFVNACHQLGLAVILDVVYNHLGPCGNYLPQFGPYFTERHHTNWGWAVNFDSAGSDEVRQFVIDNALMWLRDYHIDGLRLDAVHAIIDTSATHLLEELSERVDQLEAHVGRHLVVIAESDLNDPRIVRSREFGGYGIDAHWSDDIHHTLHAVLTGETSGYYCDFCRFDQLAAIWKSPYLYAGRYSQFRQRRHGRQPHGLPGHRFVACIQNHDQIGNRANGDRLTHLISPDRVKIGAGILLTSAYVPLLFQGEEWAASSPFQYFTSFSDKELGRAVSEGRRREFSSFGWKPDDVPDPQDLATFQRSQLRWEEIAARPHAEMLNWYKKLIALRHRIPSLSDGQLEEIESHVSEPESWMRVHRGPVTVVASLSVRSRRIPLTAGRSRHVLLTSSPEIEISEGAIQVPPDSFVVLGPDA